MTRAEYEQAAAELTAAVPVLVLPGNHDDRSAFRRVLLGQDGPPGPVNTVHRVGGVTFALVDSTIPGRSEGLLEASTLTWLQDVLAGADGPVIIAMHHPPVPLGHPLLDGILLTDPGDLAAVIQRSPQVAGLLCGHVHLSVSSMFAGVPLVIAPGVVSTLREPFATPGDVTWGTAYEAAAGPGFAVHVLDGGRLASYVRILPPV